MQTNIHTKSSLITPPPAKRQCTSDSSSPQSMATRSELAAPSPQPPLFSTELSPAFSRMDVDPPLNAIETAPLAVFPSSGSSTAIAHPAPVLGFLPGIQPSDKPGIGSKIFGFLTHTEQARLSYISKGFHKTLRSVTEVKIDPKQGDIQKALAKYLWDEKTQSIQQNRHVIFLDLSGCSQLVDADIKFLEVYFPALKFLDLNRCNNLTNVSFTETCRNLQFLSVDHCEKLENVTFLAECPRLGGLLLNQCHRLENVTFQAACPNLQELNLEQCYSLKNVMFQAEYPNLKKVGLGSCYTLTDISFLANSRQLQMLDLSGSMDISFLTKCTELQILILKGNSTLNDELLASMLAAYVHLQSFQLSSDNSLTKLPELAQCTKLGLLVLEACSAMRDVSALAQCANLQQLRLSHCPIEDVSALAKHPNLRHLMLENCRIEDVSALAQCPNLRHLTIKNCLIEDFSALANFTHLYSLELEDCPNLRDASALAQCPNLRRLTIKNCRDLTDVSALATSNNLRSLTLEEEPPRHEVLLPDIYITDVSALAQCPTLEELKITCRGVEKASLKVFNSKVKITYGTITPIQNGRMQLLGFFSERIYGEGPSPRDSQLR